MPVTSDGVHHTGINADPAQFFFTSRRRMRRAEVPPGSTVECTGCSRELTWHDDQTEIEIETSTFSSHPHGHGPRLTSGAGVVAARAAGARIATIWAPAATYGESLTPRLELGDRGVVVHQLDPAGAAKVDERHGRFADAGDLFDAAEAVLVVGDAITGLQHHQRSLADR
jgi:hypothetical protein